VRALCLAGALLCGCAGEDEIDAETKALLQQVPIGTPYQQLDGAMQRLGFSCVQDVRQFIDGGGATRDAEPHLSCTREERYWLACGRRTRVNLLQLRGRLSNVLVNIGRFC
jgi:hypothetical protein